MIYKRFLIKPLMLLKSAFIWSKRLLQFKWYVFNFNIFWSVIYSCECKAEFQQLLVKSSVSHGPSEIILICWFGAQENISYYNHYWKQLCF